MHAVDRVTQAHCAGSIAVIGVAEANELVPSCFASCGLIGPMLNRHFHSNFDSNRTGVRQKHFVTIAGQATRQSLG